MKMGVVLKGGCTNMMPYKWGVVSVPVVEMGLHERQLYKISIVEIGLLPFTLTIVPGFGMFFKDQIFTDGWSALVAANKLDLFVRDCTALSEILLTVTELQYGLVWRD